MLTVVLDRLTTLASRYFIVGAFIPVLVFAFLNGTLLYWEFNWFHAWAAPQLSAAARAFDVAAVVVGLAVVGYALWSLSGFFREVLEGGRLRPNSRLARYLRHGQSARLLALRTDYYEARDTASRISHEHSGWVKELRDAAAAGESKHPGHNTYDAKESRAAVALTNLRRLCDRAEPLPLTCITDAVAALTSELAGNDITVASSVAGGRTLAQDRLELYKLLDYAEDEWVRKDVALANRLQARYGSGTATATAFGNIAESMQSYAMTRYRLNLATFWSRLQPLLQKHKDFYPVLQDAKVQLDFLVTSTVLSALTTVVWLVALPIWTASVWLFLAVAVLGPIVTRALYLAAVENYVAFGEVVRTSVDLYRFELLDALHLPRPHSLRDERALWNALQRVSAFGQEGVDISYLQERGTPS